MKREHRSFEMYMFFIIIFIIFIIFIIIIIIIITIFFFFFFQVTIMMMNSSSYAPNASTICQHSHSPDTAWSFLFLANQRPESPEKQGKQRPSAGIFSFIWWLCLGNWGITVTNVMHICRYLFDLLHKHSIIPYITQRDFQVFEIYPSLHLFF